MRACGAVSDEDQLDRRRRPQVLRRSLEFAAPVPARRCWSALGVRRRVDARAPRRPVARAARHRPRHRRRATPARSTRRSSPTCVVVVVAYVVGRQQYSRSTAPARGSCATCASGCSTTCSAQSMAFYDRNKAGVLVSRMTSDIEIMGELVQLGLLQFVSAALLLVVSRSCCARGHQLAADARRAASCCPIIVVASSTLPARSRTTPTSTCATSVGQNLSHAAGGHRRRAGHPGVRPRGRADPPLRARRTGRSTTPTCARVRMSRLVLRARRAGRRRSPPR